MLTACVTDTGWCIVRIKKGRICSISNQYRDTYNGDVLDLDERRSTFSHVPPSLQALRGHMTKSRPLRISHAPQHSPRSAMKK